VSFAAGVTGLLLLKENKDATRSSNSNPLSGQTEVL